MSEAMQDSVDLLLLTDEKNGMDGNIFVVTDESASDDGWYISIANLVDVADPYTDWNFEQNAAWAGSVFCIGSEPAWSCQYYEPAIGGEGVGSINLVFPWRPGYKAIYGIGGVHSGTVNIPGSIAVDFVGGDTLDGSMPPYAYASESGNVTHVCNVGIYNMGVVISGTQDLYYLHLAPGQNIKSGDHYNQGQQIGVLAYGTFVDKCGRAEQGANVYHIHFAFVPGGNYFTIGGCNLNVSSQIFLCGVTPYGIQAGLPNTSSLPGGNYPVPTAIPGVTPAPGSTSYDSYTPTLGGEHIWDGIINAASDFVDSSMAGFIEALPMQDNRVDYFFSRANVIVAPLVQFFVAAYSTSSVMTSVMITAILLIITLEMAIWTINISLDLLDIVTGIWELIPIN
jgi:hypothetical protein